MGAKLTSDVLPFAPDKPVLISKHSVLLQALWHAVVALLVLISM